jgi:protein tyrosine/serine phosphatase
MDTIFKGDMATPAGRRLAWIDALLTDHALIRYFHPNFHMVVPGALYRAAHPMPSQMERYVERHGIRTIINLRGQAKNGTDALSREAAQRLGLEFHDMALESRGAPHRDRILRIASIYAAMPRPGLVHCKSGADRAGLASGLFVMCSGGSANEALRQLSLRFGHVAAAKTGILDAFFRLYRDTAEGRIPFLRWVETEYDEAALRDSFRPRITLDFITDRILRRE